MIPGGLALRLAFHVDCTADVAGHPWVREPGHASVV